MLKCKKTTFQELKVHLHAVIRKEGIVKGNLTNFETSNRLVHPKYLPTSTEFSDLSKFIPQRSLKIYPSAAKAKEGKNLIVWILKEVEPRTHRILCFQAWKPSCHIKAV